MLSHSTRRAENQLRIVALGRMNWLFAGSFEGAKRAALLYSLVQSCPLVDVPPFDYLKDVLLRVATHPQRRNQRTHTQRLGRHLPTRRRGLARSHTAVMARVQREKRALQ